MLSEIEKACVSSLLRTLELADLSELAKTCTSGALITSKMNDAINAILLHTTDYRNILMRKKITRTVLFNYLHDNNISFPGNAEKSALVELVINFWNTSTVVLESTESYCVRISGKEIITYEGFYTWSAMSWSYKLTKALLALLVDDKNKKEETPSQNICDQSLARMAVTFAEWFYKRINAIVLREMNTVNNDEQLKEEDFWRNAKVCVQLAQGSGVGVADYFSEGSDQCVALLRHICLEHSLCFSPNLCEEGTKGVSEPHGVVLIMSCGTLHSVSSNQCVGLYEQVFGLIKDPLSEWNWKIKSSKLILRSQEVTAIPSLIQSSQLSLTDI